MSFETKLEYCKLNVTYLPTNIKGNTMEDTALLVIDVQQAFKDPIWGERNNLNAETNIASLLKFWRNKQGSVIHIHHSSKVLESIFHPSNKGHQAKPEGQPISGEVIFKKTVNSAFIGTQLENYLREKQLKSLVIVGLTTDHCVSTSVRMAANLGFKVTLVSDATATFNRTLDGVEYTAEQIQAIHLASLNNEFCQLTTTKTVLVND
jgi:nicotinamidase-related amidase